MKTSNELHDLWVAQGDKVENLNEKLNVAMLDDSVTAEELQAIKNERDTAKMKRDMFKEQYTEARANEVVNMSEEDKKPLTENEEEVKSLDQQFVVASPIEIVNQFTQKYLSR